MTAAASPVLAATAWPSNAHMVEDVARLGYLRADWRTVDPTYGRGLWWARWRPDELTVHDLALDGVDFRDLPEVDGAYDAAVFDPPYVCVGGRTTTGLADMHDPDLIAELRSAVIGLGRWEVGR